MTLNAGGLQASMHLLDAWLRQPLSQLLEALRIVGKWLVFGWLLTFEQSHMKVRFTDIDA